MQTITIISRDKTTRIINLLITRPMLIYVTLFVFYVNLIKYRYINYNV